VGWDWQEKENAHRILAEGTADLTTAPKYNNELRNLKIRGILLWQVVENIKSRLCVIQIQIILGGAIRTLSRKRMVSAITRTSGAEISGVTPSNESGMPWTI
jgi:hypothetical protein